MAQIDISLTEDEYITLFVNQGWRDARVLAVRGGRALVEYEMPNGTTALRIVHIADPECGKSISYARLSQAWRKAMIKAESAWLGRPQGNGHRTVPSPGTKGVPWKWKTIERGMIELHPIKTDGKEA